MTRPRALVTGAGIRVGRTTAIELAAHGFDVVVHFRRSRDEADEVVSRCREHGVDATCMQADLGTPDGCASLVDGVRARWESLDLLVNNASLFHPVPFEQIALEEWERMLAVNLRAPFLLSQGLLPLLRAADGTRFGGADGQGGLVVHLCDIGADRPVSGYAHYSVSKAGLVMLVKAMAVELAPAVRSVGISPGHVAWPEDYDADLRDRLRRRIPMKRAGTPEDVARLVRFLVTEAPYLNGEIVAVDGGLAARY